MITYNDQEVLFTAIGKRLHKNVRCIAFGGTAMMFYGYKDDTKDIDLLFEHLEDRAEFIRVIESMGFQQSSLFNIYIPEKLDPHKPLMYSREGARFDLFVKQIFHTVTSPKMKEDMFARHEFKETYALTVAVLRKEFIVMLKSVTERDKDFEDILTIVKKEASFNWQYLIDEVLWQYKNGDNWVLMDTIKMLHELRKYVFGEQKYLKLLTKELKVNKK